MERKRNEEKCKSNACEVANYARRFPRGDWSFLGPGSEKKWYGTFSEKKLMEFGVQLLKT